MTAVRDMLIKHLYRGVDPFVGLPKGLYAVDIQGWNSRHPILTEAVRRPDPTVIVEVGVWKGGSVITMAEALKEAGADGVVIAVDTWLGSTEHWVIEKFFTDLAMDHGYPSLIRKFMNNIMERGLTDYVLPLPLDSINAAYLLKDKRISPSVIHLDGGHEYFSVLADLKVWWPLMTDGGMFIGDDYHLDGEWPGVRQAFDEFFAPLGIKQVENGNGKCWIRK